MNQGLSSKTVPSRRDSCGGHLSAAFHHRQMASAVNGHLVEMVLQVDGHSSRHDWGDERRLQLPCFGFA